MAKKSKPLVIEHLENISRVALEKYQEEIKEYVRRKKGVYALYRGDRLKYVGLATNLRGRLHTHLKDRHSETWDKFSVYLTADDEHLRELEALVIRIAAPKENRQRGRFAKSVDLWPKLKNDVSRKQKAELVEMRGGKDLKKVKIEKKALTAIGSSKIALAPYVRKSFIIKGKFKDKTYKATVLENGLIQCKGKTYASPSGAGMIVRKDGVVGWDFWKYQNEDGEWVKLKELRRKLKKAPVAPKNNRKATLSPFISKGFIIRAEFKGKKFRARVSKDGTIKYKEKIFTSPSAAGMAVIKRSVDGWIFWSFRNANGEWVLLDTLRNKPEAAV